MTLTVPQVSPCRFKDKPIPTDKIRAKCLGFCHLEKNELKLQKVVAERGPVSINIPIHDSFYNYDSGECEKEQHSLAKMSLIILEFCRLLLLTAF